jgi:hypothetical protein
MARMRLVPVLALAAALGAAGCGGGDSKKPAPSAAKPSATAVSASDQHVIQGWVDTLRAGHVSAAAAYFAVPALVQNGSPPIELRTRAQVRLFNEALPCGARLVRTVRAGRYVAATFKLTERPGGACGKGTGSEAATAFLIRGGKIAEWRRVALPGERLPNQTGPPTRSS